MPLAETGPLTRLEAVNSMLRAIGQSGVQSLSSEDGNADSENAQATFQMVLKEILGEGWHFNTDKNFPIDPNELGEIVLPANTLRIDTVWKSKNTDLALRGGKLYDRVNHTFAIGKTVYVDLVVGLEFEDLTQTTRRYIAIRAARRFAGEELASSGASKLSEKDEAEARVRMEQEDAENDDRTMAQASPHVARMRRGQRGAG